MNKHLVLLKHTQEKLSMLDKKYNLIDERHRLFSASQRLLVEMNKTDPKNIKKISALQLKFNNISIEDKRIESKIDEIEKYMDRKFYFVGK